MPKTKHTHIFCLELTTPLPYIVAFLPQNDPLNPCCKILSITSTFVPCHNHDLSKRSNARRWIAGSEPTDILQVHGVHYNEVQTSAWEIVDAINWCPELQLGFPTDHNEQRKIAAGFQALSSVDFKGCVGCIDGMLVYSNYRWMFLFMSEHFHTSSSSLYVCAWFQYEWF